MEYIKRHHDMDMGSSSSVAATATSMMMNMASMATSTMMDMSSTASASMDHDHSSMSGMSDDSGSLGHMGMHMWLTREYAGYPVLFRDLIANNKAEAFGIFVLLFVVAFLTRMLEFVRNYLEEIVWKNNNYLEHENGVIQEVSKPAPVPVATCCANARENGNFDEHAKTCCGGARADDETDDSIDKTNSPQVEPVKKKRGTSIASGIMRDAIRLALCIIPDLLSYSLMLVAMTYTLVYFFAVVIGSGVGRFTAERTMEHFRIKRTAPRDCC